MQALLCRMKNADRPTVKAKDLQDKLIDIGFNLHTEETDPLEMLELFLGNYKEALMSTKQEALAKELTLLFTVPPPLFFTKPPRIIWSQLAVPVVRLSWSNY